ncbi:hypothetical protein JCM6882_002458 [Rhodosporidiobolus microsporus]
MSALPPEAAAGAPSSPSINPPSASSTLASAEADTPDGSEEEQEQPLAGAKPKKKKKRRTTAQKNEAKRKAQEQQQQQQTEQAAPEKAEKEPYRGVYALLARNKHMKYISLFNGPWLSLSQRDLSTYLVVNSNERSRASLRGLLDDPLAMRLTALALDGASSSTLSAVASSAGVSLPAGTSPLSLSRRGAAPSAHRFPQEYLDSLAADAIPPPIDPAAFANALEVRKLVDEAADFALRASSGMSAVELEALNRNPFGGNDAFGGGGMYGGGGGGGYGGSGGGPNNRRNPPMSALRQHRFRVLAVSKLAAAYRVDEVATAVVVMQSGENLEELAERVRRQEPDNEDACYVAYFSEKIPSRAVSSANDLESLDALIARNPSCLAYYRSKGVLLSTFKQDYPAAIRAFTQGLVQAKSAREAAAQPLFGSKPSRKKGSGKGSKQTESPSSLSGSPRDSRTSSPARAADDAILPPPPALGKTAGDDLERQLLFHRGVAHFQHARQQIEDAVLDFEGVSLAAGRRNDEGGAWTLRNLGINLTDPHAGLYGSKDGAGQEQYRSTLGDAAFLDRVHSSLRKALRDLDRFLAYFALYEAPAGSPLEHLPRLSGLSGLTPPRPASLEEPLTFLGRRLVHHRALSSRTCTRDPRRPASSSSSTTPPRALLTTFHPFLLEAHSVRLLSLFLLGEFTAAAQQHATLVRLTEQLEGYPVFSAPRVGTQAEYAELVERVWGTWTKTRAATTANEDGENGAARDADEDDEPVDPSSSAVPEDKAHEGAAGPANAALKSLAAVSDLFSDSFREAYVQRAEEWWARTGKKDEEAREKADAQYQAGGRKGGVANGSVKAITAGDGVGDAKGTWLEERQKAENKMRKIDPSYAPLTTAHTELALCYLHAAVLPSLEAQEKVELDAARAAKTSKGKGKGKGKAREEDGEEELASNGLNGHGGASGSGSGSGLGRSESFDPFGTGPRPSWGGGGSGGSGSGEGGAAGSSSGKGKGKGRGA